MVVELSVFLRRYSECFTKVAYQERRAAKATLVGNLCNRFVPLEQHRVGQQGAIEGHPSVWWGPKCGVELLLELCEAHAHLSSEGDKGDLTVDVADNLLSKVRIGGVWFTHLWFVVDLCGKDSRSIWRLPERWVTDVNEL